MKRKIIVFVSQNEAKRKRNGFCFASFHFEAKKKYKRKWDTLAWIQIEIFGWIRIQVQ